MRIKTNCKSSKFEFLVSDLAWSYPQITHLRGCAFSTGLLLSSSRIELNTSQMNCRNCKSCGISEIGKYFGQQFRRSVRQNGSSKFSPHYKIISRWHFGAFFFLKDRSDIRHVLLTAYEIADALRHVAGGVGILSHVLRLQDDLHPLDRPQEGNTCRQDG